MRLLFVLLLASACRAAHARPARQTFGLFGHVFSTHLQDELDDAEDLAIEAIEAAETSGEAMMQEELLNSLDSAAERLEAAYAYDSDYFKAEAYDDLMSVIEESKRLSRQSLMSRLNPLPLVASVTAHSANDVAGAMATSVQLTRKSVHTRLDEVLSTSPRLAAAAEVFTLVMPLVTLVGLFALLRQHAGGEFSLRSELALMGHLYWFEHFALLAIATALMSAEPPMVAFALNQPHEYEIYQAVTALMYLGYLGTLARHWWATPTEATGAAQFAGALLVFFASYATITYPAVYGGLPPTCGWPTFALYALVFAGLTLCIRRERKGKPE